MAGEEGRRLLADPRRDRAALGADRRPHKVFDEALLRAQAEGVSQVVIVAAGMDARAFRLPWRAAPLFTKSTSPR